MRVWNKIQFFYKDKLCVKTILETNKSWTPKMYSASENYYPANVKNFPLCWPKYHNTNNLSFYEKNLPLLVPLICPVYMERMIYSSFTETGGSAENANKGWVNRVFELFAQISRKKLSFNDENHFLGRAAKIYIKWGLTQIGAYMKQLKHKKASLFFLLSFIGWFPIWKVPAL